MPRSPKTQRLVTPVRLQRRRHLRSLKRRRIDRQKEQKTEYEALLAKRIAEKKEKAAAVKASHKKYAPLSLSLRLSLSSLTLLTGRPSLRKTPLRGILTILCGRTLYGTTSSHVHCSPWYPL